jgi:hypothetical protein
VHFEIARAFLIPDSELNFELIEKNLDQLFAKRKEKLVIKIVLIECLQKLILLKDHPSSFILH